MLLIKWYVVILVSVELSLHSWILISLHQFLNFMSNHEGLFEGGLLMFTCKPLQKILELLCLIIGADSAYIVETHDI